MWKAVCDMTVVDAPELTSSDWLERAQSLAPVIEEYRDQSERQRHMALPIFEALARTDLLEMMVPRVFGGPQAHPIAQLLIVEEISRQDGSAGWNTMIWSGSGLFADYLSEQTAREILGVGQGT